VTCWSVLAAVSCRRKPTSWRGTPGRRRGWRRCRSPAGSGRPVAGRRGRQAAPPRSGSRRCSGWPPRACRGGPGPGGSWRTAPPAGRRRGRR
jgi:hypothetical protein